MSGRKGKQSKHIPMTVGVVAGVTVPQTEASTHSTAVRAPAAVEGLERRLPLLHTCAPGSCPA
jgi:hypothetical protein